MKSVEQDSTSSKVGNFEMVREALVLKVPQSPLVAQFMYHLPAMSSSMTPSLPRRGSQIPAQNTDTRLLN